MSVTHYYYYVLQYSPLIPLLYGLPRYKSLGKPLRILLGYLGLSLLLTIVMTFLALHGTNNLWLMNCSLPLYTALFLRMFWLWEQDQRQRWVFVALSLLFLAVWIYEILFMKRLFGFTVFARPFVGLIFIYFSCRAIYQANKNMSCFITSQPQFWIGSGLIVYYGGMFILNLLSNSLVRQSTGTLWSLLYLQPALALSSHLLYWGGLKYASPAPNDIAEVQLST